MGEAGIFRLSRRKKRLLTGLLTVVAASLIFCLISHFHLLHETHLKSGDFLYRAADSNPGADIDDKIVIVAIDEKSLEQLGRFSSWPRSYHAELINTLAEAGARVIVFDVLFSEPAPDDEELVASMKQAGNVILPFICTLQAPQPAVSGEATASGTIIKPLEQFEESALALGHANMAPDEDGVVRRLALLLPDNEHPEPALALTAIAKYLRRTEIIESLPEDNYLSFAGRAIPLDDASNMLINYRVNPATPLSFEAVSYADVLRNAISPETFRDKLVLIGVTATGFGDILWTPMGRAMSGVELHAQAMHTILTGNFLKPAPAKVTFLSIIFLALLCGLAVLRLRTPLAILSATFLGIIYFLISFYFFDHGIQLDMLYPPLAIAGSFVGVNLHNVVSEQHEKSEITKTFGRYVSPSVAKMILEGLDKGSLKLGGEERIATILFADVRNFTGFSEEINPQELVSILNRYLSVIIKAVLQHDGMINKFGGDSIMAIWNVPINSAEHALLAVKAAVTAQQALRELQERAQNLPKMEFGIGINTGNVVAGNMGSVVRLEYSVIGDAVNIAARLAGAAPGGGVWIGKETFNLVKGYVDAIPLAPLSLKGKQAKFQAYEVMGIFERQPSNQIIMDKICQG